MFRVPTNLYWSSKIIRVGVCSKLENDFELNFAEDCLMDLFRQLEIQIKGDVNEKYLYT